MSKNDEWVLSVAGIRGRAAKYSRIWDFLVVTAVVLLFMGVIHLHVMLSVGDWDMFVDWKDRQYFPLVVPISMIMIPAGLQAVFWINFRLPIGATVGGVVLLLATWITRIVGWHLWAYFPFSMVTPSHMLAGCLMLDAVLVVTQSAFFASVGGAFLFGLLFYPSNYVALAPYYVPVENMKSVASMADLIGYVFSRSGTPEYIRIIERGTLRTFESGVTWLSALFAGFVCIGVHAIFWQIGAFASSTRFLPGSKVVAQLMGVQANKSDIDPSNPTPARGSPGSGTFGAPAE